MYLWFHLWFLLDLCIPLCYVIHMVCGFICAFARLVVFPVLFLLVAQWFLQGCFCASVCGCARLVLFLVLCCAFRCAFALRWCVVFCAVLFLVVCCSFRCCFVLGWCCVCFFSPFVCPSSLSIPLVKITGSRVHSRPCPCHPCSRLLILLCTHGNFHFFLQ